MAVGEKKPVDSNGRIPENHILEISSDTVINHRIAAWKDDFNAHRMISVTGDVRFHQNLTYPGLKPRDLIVWLPPEYKIDPRRRFPVLYMHDGQNIMDPQTSAFGQDWRIDETADSLINKGLIEPIIIVGIYNSSDRSEEYAPGDLGILYMQFVVETVLPFIDHTYRTLSGPAFTATGGSSQGGLIALMLLWEYPTVFSMAACLSPAFKFENVDYISTVRETQGPGRNARIYFDIGNIGLDQRLQSQLYEMVQTLIDKGFHEGEQLFLFIEPDAEHSERFWAKRFWRPLLIFWGNYNN